MTAKNKSKAIILIERLRLAESEMFRLSSKYGVKTIDELDSLIKKGKLSEKKLGDDIFLFDSLIEEKERIEKDLAKLSISRKNTWENLQTLLELPKLNIRTS
ncbi:hypothetical protein A2690_04255 [Candidatus Roizmanbacteria bacterium RIFCSPHIGHO2_01_FULL_39_12b]|uniref:Uncharacterized protein n=1 Tax=Candidatus Roizmanbacteria bacterium RIFCSPHIGHO2_01_FULL_39_12b TaxID=1802030 RepID=A0A1F7GCC2_9BACT|nr:MAG: hypothetical protein A2690_04255 [Candidatus Roizmanbacteria bacterium RIFCSPHIGHO2_01_FULL_39_12b]OGK47153.1 MAG: hypothetical protein A3B46_01980 [Candidatus Roizmanbacteria bacterium RIFCSPLOWO2_01_FULL_39_19]